MKTEEAISILEQLFDCADEMHENTNGDIIHWNQMKAIEKAIESLKKESADNKTNEGIQSDTQATMTVEEWQKQEINRLKSALLEVERDRAKAIQSRDFYKTEYHGLIDKIAERVNRG